MRHRRPRRHCTHLVGALLIAVALPACTRAPERDEIVWRLVDADSVEAESQNATKTASFDPGAPDQPRGPSRAVIADDIRYTFDEPELRLFYRKRDSHIPDDGNLSLTVPVPPPLRSCQRLLVRAAMSGESARGTRWIVGACTSSPSGTDVTFSFTAAESLRGQTVDLWVSGREMRVGPVTRRQFTIGSVPHDARLAFSYGVEPAGWDPPGPKVTFKVSLDDTAQPVWSATLAPTQKAGDRRWFDATIPLDAYAGRQTTLTLETVLTDAPAGIDFGFPVWGNPTIVSRSTQSNRRPWNVLLVSLDTLRARSLGTYGNVRPTSPVFDALAHESTLFETAVAQSTLTPVSHMSLFSARYPSDHGVTDLHRASDPQRVPTLTERLRQARYVTAAVTEDGLLQPYLGFERGFDEYRENKSADVGSVTGQIERTFQDALVWMREHRTLPFFLFVHTYQVHSPYEPPPPYRGTFGRTDTTGPAADRDRYEEEIQYTDAWLGRLWAGVRDLGLADQTILIVTSDHGEEFAEHGALDHGSHLYDETLLVPLLVRAPGLVATDRRVSEPVGLIDVAPTVLDLLGLTPLAGVPGRSLVGLFSEDHTTRRDTESLLAERLLYGEAWATTRKLIDGTLDPNWVAPIYAVRARTLKLIWTPGVASRSLRPRLEAYDLSVDPQEQHDIAPTRDPRFTSANQELVTYLTTALNPKPAQPTAVAPADPATVEKLRALGYLR